jgi:hypothetical protein
VVCVEPIIFQMEMTMYRSPYFKRASKRFLNGSRFKTPFEAVEAGARTLEEWSRLLLEERELELVFAQRRLARRTRRSVSRSPSA